MKLLFKNTTKYTKENYENFEKFHTKKYGKKELTKMILCVMGFLYISVLNLVHKNWILVLIPILCILIAVLAKKIEFEKEGKQRKGAKEFSFYFYEKHMKIKYKKQFQRLKYFQLHKVFETEEYFFIYIDEKSSLILSKEGFEIGTAEGFSEFISNKCFFKYRNENK